MKKFNYIFLSLVSAVSLAFTACEDEAEYTPAGAATASGVYFSTEAPSTVNLDKDATSFDVEIYRGDDSADQTVELDVIIGESNVGKLDIPTVANFAKGSKVANITIGYDPTSLAYEDWIDVVLAVKDETLHSPYAEYSYAFSAGIPAPYTKVVAENGDSTATYVEDYMASMFTDFEPVAYDLEIRENDIYPGIYRLMNPYGEVWPFYVEGMTDLDNDYYIEIDARDPEGVYINLSNLGCDMGYGPCYAYSLAAHYLSQGATLDDMKDEGYCGTLKDGIITFPMKALLFYMPDYSSSLYYANSNGAFRVALPGYEVTDYTVSVTYMGKFTDASGNNTYAVADINIGEDVESARVAMIEGDDINAAINGILEGSISTTEVTQENQDTDLQFALATDGVYSIVAISYAENQAKEVGYATFEYTSGGASWESLGTGLYTDDLMTTLTVAEIFDGIIPVRYEVEIQESAKEPGLYRLVYPYGAAYPYNYEGDYDASQNYYLEIDARNPEGVYITQQVQGLDWGAGMMYAGSLADLAMTDYGYTLDACIANGFCGTLVDGVITFPIEMLGMGMPGLSNGAMLTANFNGAASVVLPEALATYATTQSLSRKTSSVNHNFDMNAAEKAERLKHYFDNKVIEKNKSPYHYEH